MQATGLLKLLVGKKVQIRRYVGEELTMLLKGDLQHMAADEFIVDNMIRLDAEQVEEILYYESEGLILLLK